MKPDMLTHLHSRGAELGAEGFLRDKLLEAAASRAVQHPFLDWYAHQRLTKRQEEILFTECFYWFRHLPFYIASMSTLTRDANLFREIMFNVSDEMCGAKTHAQIYAEFLSAIDLRHPDTYTYVPAQETIALNAGVERLYSRPPIQKAIGALFFDEAMSAVMVEKVARGLLNQGYDDRAVHFWILHIEVEKAHSQSVNNAFFPYASDLRSRKLFDEGFYELMSLVEQFWDRIDVLVRLGDKTTH